MSTMAHLAGAFAEQWGNDLFLAPEPRARVLRGVAAHDDGWAARDQQPQIRGREDPARSLSSWWGSIRPLKR